MIEMLTKPNERITAVLLAILSVCLTLVSACGNREQMRFKDGSGNAERFILEQAVSRGGQPLTTNGLPAVPGPWRYAEDQYGIVIRLPRGSYASVEALLRQAFGEPKFGPSTTTDGGKLGGYRLSPQGGSIQFGHDAGETQVIILRRLTTQEAEEGLTKAFEEMAKGERGRR